MVADPTPIKLVYLMAQNNTADYLRIKPHDFICVVNEDHYCDQMYACRAQIFHLKGCSGPLQAND